MTQTAQHISDDQFVVYGVKPSANHKTDQEQRTKGTIYDPMLEYDNVIAVPDVFLDGFVDQSAFQIWYGSRYSGKSWAKALHLLLKCDNQPYFRGVFVRHTQTAARKSQFRLFQDTIKRNPMLAAKYRVKENEMLIIHRERPDSYLQAGSFQQPEDFMGIPDLTDVWLEEPIARLFAVDRQAFEDISGTLRNPYGMPSQMHFTFNPINKSNFIFKDFFDKKLYEAATHYIKANYWNNPWCPQDRIDYLNRLKKADPERYKVDGLGKWGNIRTGFEYYVGFSLGRNTGTYPVIDSLPLHITFDFNTKPYMSATVWQVINLPNGKVQFRVVKEYTLRAPRNTIKAVCDQFKKDFKHLIEKNGLFIYGDASGKASLPLSEVQSYWASVKKHMAPYAGGHNMRLNKTNRTHQARGKNTLGRHELMAHLFSENEEFPVEIRIDDSCELTIEDYENVQEDNNGGKKKTMVKEGQNTFQKYGHLSDGADYFLDWQIRKLYRR